VFQCIDIILESLLIVKKVLMESAIKTGLLVIEAGQATAMLSACEGNPALLAALCGA
jgi:hypothetical protein